VNPEAWKIIDGKLYLNFSKAGSNQFRNNAAENIKKADEMWGGMRSQN
jgi:hypothetical protein